MRRVGHVDLQGRPCTSPTSSCTRMRTIAFAGTHGGAAHPLNGGVVEQNGVVIIDAPIQRNRSRNSIFPCRRGRSIAIGAHVFWVRLCQRVSGHV